MNMRLRLAVIIVLALLLRTVNLSTVPTWDWDEGANINYAKNIMEGRAELFYYRYHFVPHPPLYFLSLAVFFKLFGASIIAIRWFSVLCSLACLILVYGIIKGVLDEGMALLAALIYAIYPEVIFWGRMGFANNLLCVLVLSSVYFLHRFLQTRSDRDLWYCSILTGLCPVTEYSGVIFLVCLGLILHWHARERVVKAIAIAASPLAFFLLYMLFWDRVGFVRDMLSYFGIYPIVVIVLAGCAILLKGYLIKGSPFTDRIYLGGTQTPAETVVFILLSFLVFIPQDTSFFYSGKLIAWVGFSVLGLLFIENKIFRSIIIVYLVGYFSAIFSANRWDHMSIPLQALFSCGSVFFFDKTGAYAKKRFPFFAAALIVFPLAATLMADVGSFALGGICEMPSSEFHQLAEFVNGRTGNESLVLAYTYLAPELKAKTAVWEGVLPYNGLKFASMMREYDQHEFSQNLSVDNIDYAIAPESLKEAFRKSGYTALADRLENWDVVYELHYTRARQPGLASEIVRVFGGKGKCERHDVVLENPSHAQSGNRSQS